jgi:2-amino-4-hydroxy-6-hydroxymethyldihydropteridine diphosphokinase
MHDVLIAFGSNQGNSEEVFDQAKQQLGSQDDITVISASQAKITRAVGGPSKQPAYLNAAIRLNTNLDAHSLHQVLIQVETDLGRVRKQRWGARKIDLDLLLFDDLVLQSDNLTIPHPRMSFRRFVLGPAIEIAGDMIHPRSKLTIDSLVRQLNEREKLVLVVGGPGDLDWIESVPNSEWEIRPIVELSDFQSEQSSASLVAYFGIDLDSGPAISVQEDSINADLIQAARSFSGSTLELPADLDRASIEIQAAIESMAL